MTARREDLQYEAWGVIVQTSRVRAGHVANGLVQLLRLLPDPPRMRPADLAPDGRVRTYNQDVLAALRGKFGTQWALSDAARRICVGAPTEIETTDTRAHERRALLAGALNADGLVLVTGGSDPTTPGLGLAGYTSTHTLKGMHAATFLGLLSRSSRGREALRSLHGLLANSEDPHSNLVARLGIGLPDAWPAAPSQENLVDTYPLPTGGSWSALAELTGTMAKNLLDWSTQGMSKASTLMAMTDLAALILFLRLVRWRPAGDSAPPPLLLVVSPVEVEATHYTVIARAQQNLKSALAALDQSGREQTLVIEKTSARTKKTTIYWPSPDYSQKVEGAGAPVC